MAGAWQEEPAGTPPPVLGHSEGALRLPHRLHSRTQPSPTDLQRPSLKSATLARARSEVGASELTWAAAGVSGLLLMDGAVALVLGGERSPCATVGQLAYRWLYGHTVPFEPVHGLVHSLQELAVGPLRGSPGAVRPPPCQERRCTAAVPNHPFDHGFSDPPPPKER